MKTLSSALIGDPTLHDFDEVRKYLGLPEVALVEKDTYVVKALAAITAADTAPFRLVFGGGTALSRAHRLIKRMSEDIDLKIVGDREPTRPELRRLRDTIINCLLEADFRFDPKNDAHLHVGNKSRYIIFRLPYEPMSPGEGILRAELKVELAVWPLYRPAVYLPVQSFIAEAYGRPPEIASLACVSITQTAAEKFVAVTRRTAAEATDPDGPRDITLARHLYDLHAIRQHYEPVEVVALALAIIPHDAKTFGNQYPPYRANPIG